MTYKINGTELTLQPTKGRWLPRDILGIDGNGHAIYPAVYQFEINWNLGETSEYYQLLGFFDGLTATGTVSVDLPTLRSATGGFGTYAGCVIYEPEFDGYFNEHFTQARMIVSNIRAI